MSSIPSKRCRVWLPALALFILSSVLLPNHAVAAFRQVRLSFRPSPSTDVVRYRIHIGVRPGVFDRVMEIPFSLDSSGLATGVVGNLDEFVMYYLTLSAVDVRGLESQLSNELPIPAVTCATLANGRTCNDGDARTQNDSCFAGACIGTLAPAGLSSTPTPALRSARLRFQPSPDADVVRYRVLLGAASRRYDKTVDVQSFALDPQGRATTTLMGLDGTQRFLAIVAVDRKGQGSAPSNELILPAASTQPAPQALISALASFTRALQALQNLFGGS